MIILLSLIITLTLHVLLGWEWTLVGGILCGWFSPERGWLKGMGVVGSAWALYVAFDWFDAPEAVTKMLGTFGQIIGNLPGLLVVVLTIFIGCLLGVFGGLIGSSLTHLLQANRPTKAA